MKYYIQTFTGKQLDLLNPTPDMIDIESIAIGLCREGRFANQTKFYYTVGQNALYMCGLAPNDLKLEALLDDAEEAFCRDLPKPIKRQMQRSAGLRLSDYARIALPLKEAIAEKFKLHYNVKRRKKLKSLDNRLALTEELVLMKNQLMKKENYQLRWFMPYNNFPILPMTQEQVYRKFMDLFELYRRDK